MFYQGPMANPGVEINTATGGRGLADTRRSVEDVLAEVIELYYRPQDSTARQKLVELVLKAEEAYFGQWDPQVFASRQVPIPGELHLTRLFDESPGPPGYLFEPYLTPDGRRAYKARAVRAAAGFCRPGSALCRSGTTAENSAGHHRNAGASGDDPQCPGRAMIARCRGRTCLSRTRAAKCR